MLEVPPLVPTPRKFRWRDGAFSITENTPIILPPQSDDGSFRSACALRDAIARRMGRVLPIETHARVADLGPRIELRQRDGNGQGYRIRVRGERVTVDGEGPAGLRYGVETLAQLAKARIRACDVDDRPDLLERGLLIDISRGKVPTMRTLFELVDLMVRLKLNVLMLYTEHVFRFRRHPAIGKGASPMNAGELRELDGYAAERHVELVPTLQSLGHMHHLLKIPRYRHLAESERRWSISPAVRDSYKLLEELYAEYLPNFRSEWFNANCDEPVDLGKGRSKSWAERDGRGAVFRTHLDRVAALGAKFGKKTMFWGDVVHEHPEQIPLLSRELMLLDWWYEPDHDFNRVRVFKKNHIPFMVCSGTCSWNTLFPRVADSLRNITGHAEAGKKYGARGLINTDWGDNGHYNLLGNSLFGFAWGAQASWGDARVTPRAFDRAFSQHLFGDRSGKPARLYRALGGLHQTGFEHFNNSPLKTTFFDDIGEAKFISKVKKNVLERTLARLREQRERFRDTQASFGAQRQTRDEMSFAIDASILAAEKGLAYAADAPRRTFSKLAKAQSQLKERHHELWLARNRPSNFELTAKLYAASIESMKRG